VSGRTRITLAVVGLVAALTACEAPGDSSEPGQLRYFEYQIPDGGTVRCLERWPNNTGAVLDCSWPAPLAAK
jgi:hypothetical protein